MSKFLLGSAAAALFAAASASASPAAAPQPNPAPATQIEMMRVQHNPMRIQTRNEVVQHVRDLFGRLDTNRDGFLTREEGDAAKQGMGSDMRQSFARRLAERDGTRSDRGAAFDRLDSNRDGMVSRQEFMAAQPQFERHTFVMRNSPGGEPGAPGEPGKMRMRGMGMSLHGRMFESADVNRDGRLSLAEATNAALQRFDSADANHDGRLTPDERMQMHQRVKAQRQPA